jgi:hypothetical protein
MLQDRQIRFIAQDDIEDIGGIACRDDHGLGAVLRELIRGGFPIAPKKFCTVARPQDDAETHILIYAFS